MSKEYARVDVRERGGRIRIGVEINHDAIRVVEVIHNQVTAWSEHSYSHGVTAASPEFPEFLMRTLESYEPLRRQASIWALGSFPSIQIRFFSMPRPRAAHLSNMVYWTFRKEIPFDAATTVFDYDVEGEEGSGAARKLAVTAYTALQSEVESLQGVFARAGYPLSGIIIPHFAMRNLFRAGWIQQRETVLSLCVGEESSSIQIWSGNQITFSRVFITGMNTILDAMRDRHPGWSRAQAYMCLRDPAGAEAQSLESVTRAALSRLMQQVERSMAAYLVGRNTEEIRSIHVMGGLAGLPHLMEAMGTQWGIQTLGTHVIEPPNLGRGVAQPDMRASAQLTLAAGVALSSERYSPSLLHTYVQRDRERQVRKSRTWIGTVGVATLALLVGGYVAAVKVNHWKGYELSMLRGRVASYPITLSRAEIEKRLAEMEQQSLEYQALAYKCQPVSVLHELAAGLPADIGLTSIRLTSDSGAAARGVGGLSMAGLVRGLPETQESKLATYVILLEDSRAFEEVRVVKSGPGMEGAEPVLLFEVTVRLCREQGPDQPGMRVAGRDGL